MPGLLSKTKIGLLKKRRERLASRRALWDIHFQELAEYVYPRRQDFVGVTTSGEKKMSKIYDSSPIHSAELLAAGLHGMVTNPANDWFSLALTGLEETKDVMVLRYLEDASDTMFNAINRPSTGFATHAHEFYMELVIFGTAIMFVSENETRDGLFFKAIPLHQCYIAEDPFGRVDTLYRIFPFTVKQCYERWGDNCSDVVRRKFKAGDYEDEIEVAHCVMPSRYMEDERFMKKPFASVYIELASDTALQLGGYFEFPYLVARFYKASGEEYGRCPTMTALPDIKMLNKVQQTLIRGIQKAVNPAILVPDDGMMSPVRSVPDGLTYYRAGGDKPTVLNEVGTLPLGVEFADSLRNAIGRVFFLDQLQLKEGPQMTATEVIQRTEERLRLLGPVLGRLQQEFLGPLITRCFMVLNRLPGPDGEGLMPVAPDAVPEGTELKIHYVSPVALAQKQIEAQGIMRSFEVLAPFIEMDPSILDIFNKEKLVRSTTKMFGVDANVLNTQTEIAEIRNARAQQEKEQNDATTMRDQSGALLNSAKASQIMAEPPNV